MNSERKKLYASLERRIGRTPLVIYNGTVPNENTLWIKRECDNPFGSHYDRVYLALFRHWEESNSPQLGMNVLETSSGSAGVSFAGIGRLLGFNCYVMIPDDSIKKKRIDAIKAQGGTVILTPPEEDIQGFTKERIVTNIKKYRAKFLNHSMGLRGTNNETTLSSLETIAQEVLVETKIDTYVAGIGNGSSIVGPGRAFKKHSPETQIIGYMPRKTGKSEYPGLMNQEGLSNAINFPHIVEAKQLMSRVVLVDDWNIGVFNHEDLGRSSKAGIKVALEISKEITGKKILVLGYDKTERYE